LIIGGKEQVHQRAIQPSMIQNTATKRP